jgi:hypothetical protein
MSYALSVEMSGKDKEAQSNVGRGAKWNIVRRSVHCILALATIYYLLPEPLFIEGVHRWHVLLGAVLIACTVEFVRLKRKKTFPGMRSYEESRIASYVYAVIGAAVVLSISPDIVGVPCILGMAWCDPIAGELRRAKIDKMRVATFTAITYALIALFSLTILRAEPTTMILLIAVMTPLAVLSEQIEIRHLDDDFTMLVIPAVAGTLLMKII